MEPPVAISIICEFLRARLKEEKDIAEQQPDDWQWTVAEWSGPNDLVSLYSPKRALDEIEAKERIINRAEFVFIHAVDLSPRMGYTAGAERAMRDTLYDLTFPYKDHPDYDPSWSSQ
jgi:uncharacterized protein DUF6221